MATIYNKNLFILQVRIMKEHPVSVIVDRRVCPGNKEAFEKLLDAIIEASRAFAGYLDTRVLKEENLYRVLFRFDTEQNLHSWLESHERKTLVQEIDKLIDRPTTLQVITGLETWFTLPGQTTMTPPARHKMAVVTWIAITPLLIAFNYLFGEHLAKLPLVLRIAVSTPWIVLTMTYFWMPFMAKLFKKWLYKSH